MVGQVLGRLARLLGLRVLTVPGAGWLVQRSTAGPWRVRRLDSAAWLLETGRRREHFRLGPRRSRAHLVHEPRATMRAVPDVERRLARFLADLHTKWLLRELDINCVIDVGANEGQFGLRLRRLGYSGRIVSFEPVAATARVLAEAAAGDPEWRTVAAGLGEENTRAEINVAAGTLSSLRSSTAFGRSWSSKLRATAPETIELVRLDTVFDDVVAGLPDPRVYLKLDTQGYDLQAFRGAGDRIRDVLALQSEVACVPIYEEMPRMPEQLTEYERAGFELSALHPVSRHEATLRVIELDLFMVRSDARSHGVPGGTGR